MTEYGSRHKQTRFYCNFPRQRHPNGAAQVDSEGKLLWLHCNQTATVVTNQPSRRDFSEKSTLGQPTYPSNGGVW